MLEAAGSERERDGFLLAPRWKVDQLICDQAEINLNAAWQRGPAWKPPRQVLDARLRQGF